MTLINWLLTPKMHANIYFLKFSLLYENMN